MRRGKGSNGRWENKLCLALTPISGGLGGGAPLGANISKAARFSPTSPPNPLSNSASLRGEGEPENKLFPAPPSPRAA